MLEILALLCGGVGSLFGVGWIATAEIVVQVLLWGQIVGAVLMVLFIGIIVIAAALGFGLAAALASGRGVVGLLAGLAAGVGGGAVSLLSLIWYALRKGLVIAGCWMMLQGIPSIQVGDRYPRAISLNTLVIVGGVLYLIGFTWCWWPRVARLRSEYRSQSSG